MEYTQLGRTGLQVSRLCLGTMNFGPKTTEEDSFAIMDKAHELGINFFDTANTYGWKLGEGVTEQIVGRWFAQGGGRREKTVLATKVYGRMGEWPNKSRLSAFEHPAGGGRLAQTFADGPHRSVSNAPRRSEDTLGGNLAGDGSARSAR
jgi:aryl-alcohol dehydrogenase-like predicted oxidoreductase